MSSPLTHGGRGADKAFTLIELITVIAIIGILSAITFGLVRGVGEQAKINRSTSELATLSAALEAYKRHYGDYPWVGNDNNPNQINPKVGGFIPTVDDRAYHLFRALGGRLSPRHLLASNTSINNGVVRRQVDKTGTMKEKYGNAFIDFSLFSLEREKATDSPGGSLAPLPEPIDDKDKDDPDFANALLDPWGNRYLYYYRDMNNSSGATAWKLPGYVLLSAGPDGQATPPTSVGVLPASTGVDADNIYAKP